MVGGRGRGGPFINRRCGLTEVSGRGASPGEVLVVVLVALAVTFFSIVAVVALQLILVVVYCVGFL